MVAALLLTLGLLQGPNDVRADRITFYNAMLKIKEGWTPAQVKALLGPPDDISDGTWCYGTTRHGSIPVLGTVIFNKGQVQSAPAWSGRPPQPLSVISDRELFGLLRAIDALKGSDDDPLFYIRATNLLQPLGKAKAVATLFEYDRLSGWRFGNDRLFWLTHFLFVPNNPTGYFPVPAIGGYNPTPPRNEHDWPTFPTVEIDDVPLVYPVAIDIGGFPEPFWWYLRDNVKSWSLRPKPMRPPDNPFATWPKVRALPIWARYQNDSNVGHGEAMHDQLIKLIRNAADSQEVFAVSNCRWDARQQMYVRPDGSFTPDPK